MSAEKFSSNDISKIFAKLKLPTADELEARAKERYKAAFENPNQFDYWFSTVTSVLDSGEFGVKYPKTQTLPLSQELFDLILKEDAEAFESNPELVSMVAWIESAFEQFDSNVVFLKNSLFSAKHSWVDSCFIKKGTDVKRNIGNILYNWAMVSGDYPTGMVVREMIKTKPVFHAFSDMPITQEFRVFSKDGDSHSYQAYWVKGAIQDPDCDDWEAKLESIESPSEELLNVMVQTANEITRKLGGDWSVDFLIDENGEPWLIDMALTSQSYISDEKVEL